MKKKIIFSVLAAFAFTALAGCGLTGENYFTIDVYSDYVGMEEDLAAHGYYTIDLHNQSAMAAVGLKKVGYCYAVKNKDAKIGGIQLVDPNFNGKTSTRTPAEGHKWKFEKFAGFYGAGKPVDLTSITGNCALFATFTSELEDYVITVRDAYENNLFNEKVLYGKNAKETVDAEGKSALEEILKITPVHDPSADPDDYSTWRDPHQIVYTFTKWRFSVEGDKSSRAGWTYDEKAKRSFILLSMDEAVEYRFLEQTRINPFYELSNRTYTVNLSYQIRTFDKMLEKYVYADPVAMAPQEITYGEAVDVSAAGLDGYTCVGEGKNGVSTRYGEDMEIGEGEIRAKLPFPLCELYADGYRGTIVDRNSIKFGCTLTLLFEKNPEILHLKFHANCADETAVTPVDVQIGSPVKAPEVTNIPGGKVFADWGIKNELNVLEPVDPNTLILDAELYPILVTKTLNHGKLTFDYDSDLKGYSLTLVDKDATSVVASDFDLTIFPKDYPLRGIASLAGKSGETWKKLTEISFPADNQISWLAHGVFTIVRLSEVAKIDLMNTKILELHSYAFHNLPRLAEIDLPASLQVAGSELFENCTSLTKVKIDLTKDEVAARIAAKGFAANWYGDLDPSAIIYKD